MNLILCLPPDTEAKLREQAGLTGKSLEELALEALQDKLSAEVTPTPVLSPDDWTRQFQAWVSSHSSRNPRFDDSRDSIYPD